MPLRQQGTFAKPIVVVVDRKGDPYRFECSGCGARITPTTWECGRCHVQILGRNIVMRERWEKAS